VSLAEVGNAVAAPTVPILTADRAGLALSHGALCYSGAALHLLSDAAAIDAIGARYPLPGVMHYYGRVSSVPNVVRLSI
jgi:hypothetical protein